MKDLTLALFGFCIFAAFCALNYQASAPDTKTKKVYVERPYDVIAIPCPR